MYIEFSTDCKHMAIYNRKPLLEPKMGAETPKTLPKEMIKQMPKSA